MVTRSQKLIKAVVCADIRGYTAMVQENEQKALQHVEVFQSHFTEVAAQYHGNIIAFYGDGVTATFESAIEAVNASIDLQKSFIHLQIPVRFGLHAGEVTEHPPGTIHGEGVQIASAIEKTGDAGSIVLSESIRTEVLNHRQIVVKNLGKYHLPELSEKIDIYAIANQGLTIPVRKSSLHRYRKLLPRAILALLLAAVLGYGLWDLGQRFLPNDDETDIRYKNIAVKFNDFAGMPGRAELAEMTTHWISSRIEDIPGSRVVGHGKSDNDKEIMLANATLKERKDFTRTTGATNVLEGEIFPASSGDSLIFDARIIRLDEGVIEESFGPARCASSDPMVCVSALSNEILGWWATVDAKVMHPPNYDAYKAYLAAKRVWLENDSLAYLKLIEAIRLDNSFPDPYFILASYYFNQGDLSSRDSLLEVIGTRFADLNPRLESVKAYLDARAKGELIRAYRYFLNEVAHDSTDLFVNTEALINALELVNAPRKAIRLFDMIPVDSMDINNCEYCVVRLGNAAEAYTAVGEYDTALELLRMIPEKDYYDYRTIVRIFAAQNDTLGIAQTVRTAIARDVSFPDRLWSDAAWYYTLDGNLELASTYARRAVEVHLPSKTYPSSIEGMYLLADYTFIDSLHMQRIERYSGNEYVMSYAGRIFAHTGNVAGLTRLDQIMTSAENDDPYHYGIYTYLRGVIACIQGQYDTSLDLLESAYRQGHPFYGKYYSLDIDLMPLFEMPRFKALIDPIGNER